MTEELKPCPECGSDFLNIMTEHTSGNRVIHCMDCHKYYYELNLTREDSRSDIFSKWNEYAQNYDPNCNPALMTEPTLKPCPFCGCKVTISKREDIWEFQHPKNDCFLGRLTPYMQDVEDATERWNRRVKE